MELNREQRRAAKSKKAQKKLQKQIILQTITEQEKRQIIQYTVNSYSACLALALKDNLGFGEKRAKSFLNEVMKKFECIEEGYVSVNEIREQVSEELNIEFA